MERHIGKDTQTHCLNCHHHHCTICKTCHRCGCTDWGNNTKEKPDHIKEYERRHGKQIKKLKERKRIKQKRYRLNKRLRSLNNGHAENTRKEE